MDCAKLAVRYSKEEFDAAFPDYQQINEAYRKSKGFIELVK
jgi:hypothetical protein